jgi:hypothetical protein
MANTEPLDPNRWEAARLTAPVPAPMSIIFEPAGTAAYSTRSAPKIREEVGADSAVTGGGTIKHSAAPDSLRRAEPHGSNRTANQILSDWAWVPHTPAEGATPVLRCPPDNQGP